MAEEPKRRMSIVQGDKSKWITPSCLAELLQVKAQFPFAPLVIGNTLIGPPVNLTGSFYPIIISPARVPELSIVNFAEKGITIGAACSIAMVRSILSEAVSQLPQDKGKIFQVILQQLSGEHIRSEASLGGSILSGSSTWDLNPILAVGNCTFNLASKDRKRQVTMRQLVFDESSALTPEEILISINVPFSRKGEYVSAFRQVQRWGSTTPATIAAMRVMLREDADLVMSMSIYYGGSELACMLAKNVSEMLVGRRWNETMLDEACRLFLEELPVEESVYFDVAEYERTLAISFLFQFYLEVSKELKQTNHQIAAQEIKDTTSTSNSKIPVKEGQQNFNGFHADEEADNVFEDTKEKPMKFTKHMLQTIEEEEFDDEDTSAVDGELFLALVTSSRHHAKITSINTDDALKVPGVVGVITSADVPGISNSDLFAENEVTYIGQAICAVVAKTQSHANIGASRVRVIYEDLEPSVLSIQDSIKHDSFYKPMKQLEYGNVDKAFSNVDYVLEGEDYIEGQDDLLVPQTVRVIPSAEEDEMEVFISTQDPASIQAAVASALNYPSDQVLCCAEKPQGTEHSHAASQAAITAVAAHKTGQVVTSVVQNKEKSPILRHQPPFFGKYKVGYMEDGRIVALDVTYYCNSGHRPDESLKVLTMCLLSASNAYGIPNLRCSVVACKTNLPAKKFYSGYGFAQAAIFAEIWVDRVADRCGLPPEKVRCMNLHKGNSDTTMKKMVDAERLLNCWDKCLELSSYHDRRAKATESNKECSWKKRGFSVIPAIFPVGLVADCLSKASVLVHICADGWVLVTPAGSDLEQETLTKILQVVSRELRVPISYIRISESSATFAPENEVSVSSCDTQVYLMAVQEACQELLKRLQPIICLNPTATWTECIQEAFRLRTCLSSAVQYRSPDTVLHWEPKAGPDYLFGVACSEVELDCRTGNHKTLRTDIVLDVGSTVNEDTTIQQVKKIFSHGLKLYLKEDLKFSMPSPSTNGATNGAQSSQKYPLSLRDVSEELNVTLLPSSQGGECSAMALEEMAVFLGSSVFFAVKDAILAARQHTGLPGTILLSVPARPQHIRITSGHHLIEYTNTLDKEECTLTNSVSKT